VSRAPLLELEKRVGRRTLRVDVLVVPIVQDLAAQAGPGGKTTMMGTHQAVGFHKYLRS
jgi:hypothetical protein